MVADRGKQVSVSSLLDPAEEAPVAIRRPDGASDVLLVCEHASRRLPRSLGTLGLDHATLESHIAWDIGGLAVAERLSDALDATLVAQTYSRLAYDCNRPPESAAAVPATSEIFDVPGNKDLTPDALKARADTFYHPFQDAVAAVVAARRAAGRRVAIVTMHTFTPVYFGAQRKVEIGVLHDADTRLADALLAALAGAAAGMRVERNEPYGPADGVTHTLRLQALPHGLLNVMIEIRNDLVRSADGQEKLAGIIAGGLAAALAAVSGPALSELGGSA
jgi:predicted N-formylglutamate amidohydrolase